MRKRSVETIVKQLLSATLAFSFLWSAQLVMCKASNEVESNNSYEASVINSTDYDEYSDKFKAEVCPSQEVIINNKDSFAADKLVAAEGVENCILSEATGQYKWEFNVPQKGLYNIEFTYIPVSGNNGAIERILFVNDELPFKEASFLEFSRSYSDVGGIKTDKNGDQQKPDYQENIKVMTATLQDPLGYHTDPLRFYFDAGKQSITLKSVKEAMYICSIRLYKYEEPISYQEYKDRFSSEPDNAKTIYIEAEDTCEKSEFSIYPYADRSSSSTSPQSAQQIKLNVIGGSKWQSPGQWISWQTDVKNAGFYKIVTRYRQNTYDGMPVNRKLYIDGEIPFAEAANLSFKSSRGWETMALGSDDEYYLFYFSEGQHTITMEVTLGKLTSVLNSIDNSLVDLNRIYREVLLYVGATPDLYRDYDFPGTIPDTLEAMKTQSKILKSAVEELENIGFNGEQLSIVNKVIILLDEMVNNPNTIASKFSSSNADNYKDSTAALGTWILQQGQQPLELDYIELLPDSQELPKAEKGFISNFIFQIKCLVASFADEYTTAEENGEDELTVWISTGRDQAQIINRLAQDDFSQNTGIAVSVELISEGTLLPSVLCGKGPDVALSVANSDPVNYAARKAALDLSGFDGFEEIKKRFASNALEPYEFNGGIYALPEKQSFLVMFYRKDIFEEIGVLPPKTWDEFYQIIPELQKRNMIIGYPINYQGYLTFLYQRNLSIYNEERNGTALNTNVALDAFEQLTNLFAKYSFPYEFDFANRFRSGEMPLAIGDYTLCNNLYLFASEIRGLWEFVPLPGTVCEDGTVNNATPADGLGAMILSSAKNKEAAWKFLDWWTSAEAQSSFANELEAVIGVGSKYASANIEAVSKMSWSASEYNNIKAAWENAVATPEVPGGYMIKRNIEFAISSVYNYGYDSSQQLLKYAESADGEITRKLREFGVDLK